MQPDHGSSHRGFLERGSKVEASLSRALQAGSGAQTATDYVQLSLALPPLSSASAGDGDGSCTAMCTLSSDEETHTECEYSECSGEIRRSELHYKKSDVRVPKWG